MLLQLTCSRKLHPLYFRSSRYQYRCGGNPAIKQHDLLGVQVRVLDSFVESSEYKRPHLRVKDVLKLRRRGTPAHKQHLLLCVWVDELADSLPQRIEDERCVEHDQNAQALWVAILKNLKDGLEPAKIQAI